MDRSAIQRYSDIAVLFHWLIALLIIGLLAIGKYMTGLEENDPVRFVLTQWHKSFGISVLLLSVLRLMWRFVHKPPPEPDYIPRWQQFIAGGVHLLLYALMFLLPITGWIMVSASPLNLDTVLFGVIPWPHLPPFPHLPNKAGVAEAFHSYHEIASTVLIVFVLAHVGAAMKHHLVDKDTVLHRMLPVWSSESFTNALGALVLLVGGAVGASFLYAQANNTAALLAAGESEVSFVADVTGDQTAGVFTQSSVEALIDESNPANSTITARVQTGSLRSDNDQVEGSLPDPEWFSSEAFPEAVFESTSITGQDDGTLNVTGNLTIKEITQSVSFPMIIANEEGKRVARGEFNINRPKFNIGMESQANDDYVGFDVLVKFRFDITAPDG